MRFDPVISYFTALCYIHTNNQKLSINILWLYATNLAHRSRELSTAMALKQPVGQKRLTNVAVVRLSTFHQTTIGDRPSSWVDHGNGQFLKIWVPPNPHKSTASPFSPYFNHQDRVVFPGCRWRSINFQASHFSYTLPIWVLSCFIQIFRHTQIFRNEIPWDSLWNRLSLDCILHWIGSREILPPTKDLVGGFNMSQVCSKYGKWSQATVTWNQQPAMIGPSWTWISMFFSENPPVYTHL